MKRFIDNRNKTLPWLLGLLLPFLPAIATAQETAPVSSSGMSARRAVHRLGINGTGGTAAIGSSHFTSGYQDDEQRAISYVGSSS